MTTNRSIKTGMATLALVAAVAFGGAALSPILVKAKADDRTFTHSFRQVSADEVLAWMQGQGINIKVQRSDLPRGMMTFAFDGICRDDLVKTFGSMVGLQSERRGDVYSLMKGVGGDGQAEPLGSEDTKACQGRGLIGSFFISPDDVQGVPAEIWQSIPGELPDFEFDGDLDQEFEMIGHPQDPGAIIEEVMKALEEAGVFQGKKMTESEKQMLKERLHERISKMRSAPGFFGPEGLHFKMFDPRQMKGLSEEQRKEYEKAMADAHKAGAFKFKMLDPTQMKGLTEEQRKEFEKAMADAHKAGAFKFKMLDPGKMKGMDEAQRKAYEQAMEEMHKSGSFMKLTPEQLEKMKAEGFYKLDKTHFDEMRKAMEEMHKSGGFMKLTPEQLEKMKAEGHFFNDEAFKKHMEEMHKHLGENLKVMQLKLENLKKFMASLTPAQKELAKKQGHLRPEDLTQSQRSLLGIDGKGDVDMTFQNDGEKITIKGKGTEKTTGQRKGVITA